MPTRELYVQGTQEQQLPGFKPPHWTTEDYRSRYWAVYVSYQFSCFANRRGAFPIGFRGLGHGMSRQVHYGVLNKGRLGSGVPHREPFVLHVTVEAVAGDLGASQTSSQLTGEGGAAKEGKSSCRMPHMGVARGERETARDRHPEDGSVRCAE